MIIILMIVMIIMIIIIMIIGRRLFDPEETLGTGQTGTWPKRAPSLSLASSFAANQVVKPAQYIYIYIYIERERDR